MPFFYLTFLLVLFFGLLFIGFPGCSKGESPVQEEEKDAYAQPKESGVDATEELAGDFEESESEDFETEGLTDRGTDCKNHEYVLAPGSTETLTFELKLKREVLNFKRYEKQKVKEEDISIQDSLNYWKKYINAEVESVELEVVETYTPMWAVDATELIADHLNRDKGVLTRISETHGSRTKYEIIFSLGQNLGIFSNIGGVRPETAVMKLTEDEVMEKLGGNLSVTHLYDGKNYELLVEQMDIESEIYFITINMNVSIPKNYNKKNVGCENWKIVKIKDQTDIKFVLKFTFNKKKKDNRVHIFGPAVTSYCL